MQLLKIEQSSNNDSIYILSFEDSSIKVKLDIIASYSLYSGMEISEELYDEIKKASRTANMKSKAVSIITKRPLSKSDLKNRLIKNDEDEHDVNDAINWLENIGVLNDVEYASMIVRHYTNKNYGVSKIKSELYRHGIDKELWEEALSEIPCQDDAIDKFIESKLKGAIPDKKDIKRISDTLYRRGYSWDIIKKALRRYDDNLEDYD